MRDFWEDDYDYHQRRNRMSFMSVRDVHMTTGESFSVVQSNDYHSHAGQIFDQEFASKLKAFTDVNDRFRRSGRSTLMARIIIEQSIESGCPIALVDHTDFNPSLQGRDVRRYFLGVIREQIYWYESQGVNLQILRFDERSIHVAINHHSVQDCHRNYMKIRIPDYVPNVNQKPRKEKMDDLLLICCNIV